MRARRPHYFLRTQAAAPPESPRWAFSLQAGDHSPPITAGDLEPNASWERLQLLAVVRGLEALPEPALVTLATASDVVRRGIRHGLEEWRELDWQLELFGELIPVKNADLWKRIDRALAIHDVQIRNVRVDEPIIAELSDQPHFVEERSQARHPRTVLSGSRSSTIEDQHPSSATTWSEQTSTRQPSLESDYGWDEIAEDDDNEQRYEDRPAQKTGNTWSRHPRERITSPRRNNLPLANREVKNHARRPFRLLRLRRRLRASLLHIVRRTVELWDSWLWFYETTGLQQWTQKRQPRPAPWLRDKQQRE